MKKYPAALADVNALRFVLEILYERAEEFDASAKQYRACINDTGENDWDEARYSESIELAYACRRLAERLSK